MTIKVTRNIIKQWPMMQSHTYILYHRMTAQTVKMLKRNYCSYLVQCLHMRWRLDSERKFISRIYSL